MVYTKSSYTNRHHKFTCFVHWCHVVPKLGTLQIYPDYNPGLSFLNWDNLEKSLHEILLQGWWDWGMEQVSRTVCNVSWVNKGGMSSCGTNSELITAHTLRSWGNICPPCLQGKEMLRIQELNIKLVKLVSGLMKQTHLWIWKRAKRQLRMKEQR